MVCPLLLPVLHSFNKTEAAIFPIQAMFLYDFSFFLRLIARMGVCLTACITAKVIPWQSVHLTNVPGCTCTTCTV